MDADVTIEIRVEPRSHVGEESVTALDVPNPDRLALAQYRSCIG
jgi:hypothetical protein